MSFTTHAKAPQSTREPDSQECNASQAAGFGLPGCRGTPEWWATSDMDGAPGPDRAAYVDGALAKDWDGADLSWASDSFNCSAQHGETLNGQAGYVDFAEQTDGTRAHEVLR